jgi:hypothetical protein
MAWTSPEPVAAMKLAAAATTASAVAIWRVRLHLQARVVPKQALAAQARVVPVQAV